MKSWSEYISLLFFSFLAFVTFFNGLVFVETRSKCIYLPISLPNQVPLKSGQRVSIVTGRNAMATDGSLKISSV